MKLTTLETFTLQPGDVKCGIEIHQQLEGRKLHCHCPTLLTSEQAETIITRQLNSVAGETGEHDTAALMQAQRNKTYMYEAPRASTCLIDLDEAPPLASSPEALATALQLCKLLNCAIVDEAHVMRKTVVDGSNTAGFQRTTLIGLNGTLAVKEQTVGIQTLILEEDSAGIVHNTPTTTTYRLDRLGIPLLEIATAPDITTPEQARDVAETIGLLIRATGKAKRGIGTIRQDLNVSIARGNRVEIKGAQDLKLLPEYVRREALRQHNILQLIPHLKPVELRPPITATELFKGTSSKIIATAITKGKNVHAGKLTNAKGLLGAELQPGKRLATELSDYAKAETGITGLLHSDELPGYGITDAEVNAILNSLRCTANDGFIIILEDERLAYKAFGAITERLHQFTQGVPKEVRKPLPDGNTSYLRAMPGASRLYPETDVLPIMITKQLLDSIPLPETHESKLQRYKNDGLSNDHAKALARSEHSQIYDDLSKLSNIQKPHLAELLLAGKEMIKTKTGKEVRAIASEKYETIITAYSEGRITKEGILPLLASEHPEQELNNYSPLDDAAIKKVIKEVITGHESEPLGALIGKTLATLKGRADAAKVKRLLQEIVIKKEK